MEMEKGGRDGREGGGKGKGGRGEVKGEGRGGKRSEGEGGRFDPPLCLYFPPPLHTIKNRENFHFKVSNRLSAISAGFYHCPCPS